MKEEFPTPIAEAIRFTNFTKEDFQKPLSQIGPEEILNQLKFLWSGHANTKNHLGQSIEVPDFVSSRILEIEKYLRTCMTSQKVKEGTFLAAASKEYAPVFLVDAGGRKPIDLKVEPSSLKNFIGRQLPPMPNQMGGATIGGPQQKQFM